MGEGFHADVVAAIELLASLGIDCPDLAIEPDNSEYGGAISDSAGVRLRVGKLTPRKVGLFVTVWRRAAGGSTEPLPDADGVRFLVIAVREGERFGLFVFSRAALRTHGISSANGVGGKRGFRVYPPWSATPNAQATRSQKWQGEYFLELSAPASASASASGSTPDSELESVARQRAQQLLAAV